MHIFLLGVAGLCIMVLSVEAADEAKARRPFLGRISVEPFRQLS
jgi:hypothetical protein